MQFFKGELRLEDLYYRDREAVQVVARKLNSEFWVTCSVIGLHAVISKVTMSMAIFLIMYEGQDAGMNEIDGICRRFVSELAEQSGIDKVDNFKDAIAYSEITLDTFCDLFTEEWQVKMYEDRSLIMNCLRIDLNKCVCRESLLDALGDLKVRQKYIPRDELVRIQNSRVGKGIVVYQPVHYIVIESNEKLAEKIDEEIIYELRKAGRIVSRRKMKLTNSELSQIETHRCIIQNLNNIDGGVVTVNLQNCESSDAIMLIKAVYSEAGHYLGKYEVIFNVAEGRQDILEAIKEVCKLWPFITISNKRLRKDAAVKQLKEIAVDNNVEVSKEDCLKILQDKDDYSYDEINELFRRWILTDYNVNTYHPQYRNTIDEYYSKIIEENDALVELEGLVGLREVKDLCRKIIDYYGLQKIRKKEFNNLEDIGMHMVFTGNPGTAKTTVARLMAKIFKQKGILSKGELIEVGRSDLVGKYVGWTARIVKEYFDRAKGSVLFIDEAYSLVDDDKNSFGKEAINTIVQEMENKRDDVVVIFAGYKKEMHEFCSSNSGLYSRISFYVDFPDYSGCELYKILQIFAERNHFKLEKDVQDAFTKLLESQDNTVKGNGRMVRNEFEKAKLRQAERIMKLPIEMRKKELFTLVGSDFEGGKK